MTPPTALAQVARPLTIASRRSALALAQSTQVGAQLRDALGVEVALVEVSSLGDLDSRPLTAIGGAGVFVSALRATVEAGDADVAVHSLKDLPTAPAPMLRLAAVPLREDPSDVLVCAAPWSSLAELPRGARVGTGSPRRVAQLGALRPDLTIVAVRGNVDTRIAKVRSGELDAVVLARAGLVRLGRLADVSYAFAPGEMLPAPGQGALAIECRAADTDLADQISAALDDPVSRACVEAERAVLAGLEAGCSAPVGALARVVDGSLTLEAVVGSDLHDRLSARHEPQRPGAARELGEALAQRLLARGAAVGLIRDGMGHQ